MTTGIHSATTNVFDGRLSRTKGTFTSHLRWCVAHSEPVWQYEDGSVSCWAETYLSEWGADHEVVDLVVSDFREYPEVTS